VRLTALLATLTILTLAFAGCSDGGGDGDGETSSSTSTTQAGSGSASSSSSGTKSSTGTGSATATGTGSASNEAPTGTVSASVNGTNATFTLTGSDADGDALTWELDFGDDSALEDGTTLPATVNHTYAVGNYTANFTVADGKENKTYMVEINVTAAGGAGGVSQDAVAEYVVGQSFCAGEYPPMGGDVFYGEIAIDAATAGLPFTATWAYTANPALGVQVIFVDAADTTVGDINDSAQGVLITGTVPAGAVTAKFGDCGSVGGATVTYHAG
jgi:PKD repeat protein